MGYTEAQLRIRMVSLGLGWKINSGLLNSLIEKPDR
jgi:hypothetical protein